MSFGIGATSSADGLAGESVAIVGIGCRYPGGIRDANSYWNLLRQGRDAIVDIPAGRWSARKFYDPDLGPGHSRVQRGGFLEQDVSQWDAQFFGVSPREADFVDPQHRFLMEVAYEAIEDAGIPVDTLAGSRTGVFVGGFTLDYSQLQFSGAGRSRNLLRAHTATGVVMTMFSNRISHAFDLVGPSMTVDTACSSSLVAVHLACQSLLSGESTMAIAGGVNLMLAPNFTIAASQGGFLSPTSRSRPFHAEADGYVRAEGCGVVFLEPLSAALESGRDIYAIIRGTAANQDGRTNGITVPNGVSQQKAMRHALEVSGIARDDVGYVEAHGTGTPVGDPIEANAIGEVYGRGRDPRSPCMIASVKSNFGHTEAAAGVAGLIKAALVLRHRLVPPHLHLTELNPKIDLNELGLQIPTEPCALAARDGLVFAAVNSFGFGGTNAHVILQGVAAPDTGSEDAERSPASLGITPVLPLAARSSGALAAMAGQDLQLLANGVGAEQIAAARVHRRALHTQYRAAVIAEDPGSTRAALDALADGSPHTDLITGGSAGSKLVWLFTGMGPQWWGMARGLLEQNPVFAAEVERVDASLTPLAGWSILDELRRDEHSSMMDQTRISQCANFTVQLGLAAIWRELGVPMDGVIGHSAGEVAAAYVAGALSFEDAVTVVFHRARLQHKTSGQGRLLAASISLQEALRLAPVVDGTLHLAAVNGPESIALVGDVDTLTTVQHDLESRDVFARLVPGDVPFHGPRMDPLEDELRQVLADVAPKSPACTMYSTVSGKLVTGPDHDADYWWRNVRQPVQFAAAARAAIGDGYRAFLELGPNPVLGYSVQSCLAAAGVDGVTVASLRRNEPDAQSMAAACARLFVNGLCPDWKAFYRKPGSVRLPLYPWHHESYWMESEETRADRTGDMSHPLLGRRQDTSTPTWFRELDGSRPGYLADHVVHGANLFPGAGYVDMALRAGREEAPAASLSMFDVTFHNPVVMQGTLSGELETVLDRTTSMVQINGRAAPDRPWIRQMTGFLAPARGAARHFDIAAARERCPSSLSSTECYSTFAAGGFDYGPQFQMIEALWLGEGEAVARFDSQLLGGQARADRGEAVLDPILLDGCFQLLLPLAKAQSVDLAKAIPVRVGRIEMLPALANHTFRETVWAHARITEIEPDVVAGDVVATDDAGNVLLQVERFQVRLVDPDAQLPRHGQHWLYQVDWEPTETNESEHLAQALTATASAPVTDHETLTSSPQPEPAPMHQARHWLLLNPGTGLGERLAHLLTARGDQVLMATTDTRGRDLTRGLRVARLGNRSDLDAVLGWASAELGDKTPGVIDLRALSAPEFSLDRSPSLAHQCAGGLLDLVQAMDARDLAWPLTIVTAGAQPVTDAVGQSGVGQAAVWGMGRVLHQESVELAPRLVDLDPEDPQESLPALVDELTSNTGEDQVGLRREGRFVARLQPSLEPDTWLPVRLAPFASYLITGGLGALGVVCARWLARRGARRVVLTGRRGLPPRDEWDKVTDKRQRELIDAVLGIEQQGTTVEVVALDTADSGQVREFVSQRRRAALPPIHGVLHAAGVLHDTVMVRMSSEDLHAVLKPKVDGTLALHRGLEGEPLDFFALFSSVSSVVVTTGQGNYAAANAYMDAFASHLRAAGVAAVSINWGPWDVGMIAEMNLQAFYGRRGIDLIPELVGVQLLSVILGKSTAQQVVVSADWATLIGSYPVVPRMIEHLSHVDAGDQDNIEGTDWKTVIATAEADQRKAIVTDAVADVLGTVLRISPDELNRDVPLNQLGLDSMIAVEVRIRIERALGYSPKVVTLLQGVTVNDVASLIDSELAPLDQEASDDISELVQDVDPDVLDALLSEIEQVGPNGMPS